MSARNPYGPFAETVAAYQHATNPPKPRRKPQPYNGHHCWNCWNVALWIDNDEPLYRAALECLIRNDGTPATLSQAAVRFLEEVVGQSSKTPDGARYTYKAVRHALEGLRE